MTIKKFNILIIAMVFSSGLAAQSDSEQDSLTLYTYIAGKPDMTWVKAKKLLAHKLGLKTEFFYGDCVGTFDDKAAEFELKNQPAFEQLKKHYGTDWETQFDKEISQMADIKSKRE